MAKKRVHELAKQYDMPAAEVMKRLNDYGLNVKAAASAVDETEANDIDPSRAELSNALAQNQQTVNALPEDLRDDFTELLRSYVEAQLIVQEAGEQAAGPDAGPDQLAAAGIQQRNEWLAQQGVEVELDPRFGEYQDGGIDGSGGSLSIPVSDRAAAGDSTEPSPEWVSDLPMSQKCG